MNVEELNEIMDDDTIQLEVLKKDIENLNSEINKYFDDKTEITDKIYKILHYKIEDALYGVADLSLPYFRISERLRYYYFNKYRGEPILGRNTYFERYEELHKPYTLLKNRCYRMFDKLDNLKKEF